MHRTIAPPQKLSGRLRILVGVLLVCAIAYPIAYLVRPRTPPPPTTADVETLRVYWRQRIRTDVSDAAAFLALGKLEERAGFASAAIDLLYSARALGAPDTEVCGPLGRALTLLARDSEALPELEKAYHLVPDSIEACVNLAGYHVNRGDSTQAASVLQGFVTAHPALPASDAGRIGLALLECGRYAEARTLVEKCLQATPGDPILLSVAARGSLAVGDLPVARRHLESLLAQSDKDAGIHFLYGKTLSAQGDVRRALTEWETVIRLNPMALDAHEQIGLTTYTQKNFSRAATAFETIAQHAPSATSALRASEGWRAAGDSERAAYWHSVSLGYGRHFPEALAQAQIAIRSKRSDIHRLGLQAAAESYRGLHRKREYLDTMQKLTAGGTVDDLLLRARAYEATDDHEKRTETLRRAAEKATVAEEKAAVLVTLSRAYNTRGMLEVRERALEEAVRLVPTNAAYQSELASAYFARRAQGDRTQKAIRAWETAIRLSPDSSDDWLQLGVAYGAAGERGKAISTLQHAVDLEPGNGPAYQELSRSYARIGDRESAKRFNDLYARYVTFDQTLQSLRARAGRPGASVPDLIAYGDALIKTGAMDAAANQYEAARAKQPNDTTIRTKLILLYGRLRMPERQQALLAEASPQNLSKETR